jgi:hypothetical protein
MKSIYNRLSRIIKFFVTVVVAMVGVGVAMVGVIYMQSK